MPSWEAFHALTTPTLGISPSAITAASGTVYMARSSGSGSTAGHFIDKGGNSVLVTSLYGLLLQRQKQVSMLMAAGVLAGPGATGDALVDRALLVIQTTLSYRNSMTIDGVAYTGPDGSFPAQYFGNPKNRGYFHSKLIALDRIAYALLLFRDSAFNTGARATTYSTLLDQFEVCAEWAADPSTGNVDGFFRNTPAANQLLRVAAFFEKAGVLLGNQTMRDLSESFTRQILADYFVDDIFQEVPDRSTPGDGAIGVGFDINYSLVSIELMADMYMTLPAGAWKDEVEAVIDAAATRYLEAVDLDTGLLSAVGSTRSKEVFPRQPGSTFYGSTGVCFRLHYINYLRDAVIPDDLADLQNGIGQQFSHAGDDPPDDPLPPTMIILDSTDIATVEGPSSDTDYPYASIPRIERVGGGACAAYPGGTLPDPVFILNAAVAYDPAHAAHATYLLTLPTLETDDIGFPAAPN